MIRRAICVLMIGNKYINMLKYSNIDLYVTRCKADLIVIDTPPDPSFKRNLLYQKLLIPSLLRNYDEACFLDLDIIISQEAPIIFDELPVEKSFGAILDPRGTDAYKNTWKIDRIINETTKDYFIRRGFNVSEKISVEGSINGGVFLFRPEEVWELFSEYYFSDHQQGKYTATEEAPMAYYTQINSIFYPLDERYNCQVLYRIEGGYDTGNEIIRNNQRILTKCCNVLIRVTKGYRMVPTKTYRNYVSELLKECYIIHFAGNYPIPHGIKGSLS